MVSSPELVKEIAKNYDVVFSNRPKQTGSQIIFYGAKDMAFCSYGEYWKQARRICALKLFSLKRVKSFQSVREEETEVLVNKLREASLSGVSVNLSKILTSTSNNIVSRCVIGQRYDSEEGAGELGEVSKRMVVQLVAFCVGDFFPSLRWIDEIRGFIRSLKATSKVLDAFYGKVFEEHKALMMNRTSDGSDGNNGITSNPKDFVDILLQLQNDRSISELELTNEHIKALLTVSFSHFLSLSI